MPELKHSDALLNEHGVAGGCPNNCPSREDRPEITDGGIDGPPHPALRGPSGARTARGGRRARGFPGGAFSGISPRGAPWSSRIPGRGGSWAWWRGSIGWPRGVPDDEVALLANTYSIREVDLTDKANFLGCADLKDYAKARGWYDPAKGSPSASRRPTGRRAAGSTHRTCTASSAGTMLLAAKTRAPSRGGAPALFGEAPQGARGGGSHRRAPGPLRGGALLAWRGLRPEEFPIAATPEASAARRRTRPACSSSAPTGPWPWGCVWWCALLAALHDPVRTLLFRHGRGAGGHGARDRDEGQDPALSPGLPDLLRFGPLGWMRITGSESVR